MNCELILLLIFSFTFFSVWLHIYRQCVPISFSFRNAFNSYIEGIFVSPLALFGVWPVYLYSYTRIMHVLFHFFFWIEMIEIEPMTSAPWWLLFIIKPRHQLVFGVDGIWTQAPYATIRDFTSWANWNPLCFFTLDRFLLML